MQRVRACVFVCGRRQEKGEGRRTRWIEEQRSVPSSDRGAHKRRGRQSLRCDPRDERSEVAAHLPFSLLLLFLECRGQIRGRSRATVRPRQGRGVSSPPFVPFPIKEKKAESSLNAEAVASASSASAHSVLFQRQLRQPPRRTTVFSFEIISNSSKSGGKKKKGRRQLQEERRQQCSARAFSLSTNLEKKRQRTKRRGRKRQQKKCGNKRCTQKEKELKAEKFIVVFVRCLCVCVCVSTPFTSLPQLRENDVDVLHEKRRRVQLVVQRVSLVHVKGDTQRVLGVDALHGRERNQPGADWCLVAVAWSDPTKTESRRIAP